ncbi:pyridoxamine 5'-phosphate oxidase family protein [Paenibacillus sp. y28]|uniref:pyridoxamine 5'-phosphate oxidase family protein n=1 Tax=Paenibacillus sp. y28 TaxID=3129110 RepID=UPI003016A866
MAELVTALSEPLLSLLRQQTLVLLGTTDAQTDSPAISAISWVYAVNAKTVRFAIDQRSRVVANLGKQPLAVLTVFGEGTINAIYGKARLVCEALEEVPFKLACFDVEIDTVRDAMFYGSRISVDPEYEKTYNKQAAEKLDGQVFSAMKKA